MSSNWLRLVTDEGAAAETTTDANDVERKGAPHASALVDLHARRAGEESFPDDAA